MELVLMNGSHKFYRDGDEIVICANVDGEPEVLRMPHALAAEIAHVMPRLIDAPTPGDSGSGSDERKGE